MARFRILVLLTLLMALRPLCAATATDLLQAGPLVGYAEMREVALWVQTAEAAEVQFHYWPKDDPADRGSTPVTKTRQEDFYTAILTAGPLKPGTQYEYALVINGQPVPLDYATAFRTVPDYRDRFPPPDFTVALGGGNYVNDQLYDPPNRIPGEGHNIFLAILAKQPDLMVWLGNNITLREADWGSRSGMFARYSHNRTQPELQPLMSGVNHVAAWSGRDYGPPQADRHHLGREHAQEAFRKFWPNPPHEQTDFIGNACSFRWADAEFFILDDRSFRDLSSPSDKQKVILGQAQTKWLIESLKKSQAAFKIVVMGSPLFNPAESPEHYNAAPEERDRLLEQITWAEIDGLFVVSGGKDFGELTKTVRSAAPDVYELTLGPLTARPARDTGELNYFRVPGTTTFDRHFATLKFHGTEDDRQLTVTVFDVDGNQLWTRTFAQASMRL